MNAQRSGRHTGAGSNSKATMQTLVPNRSVSNDDAASRRFSTIPSPTRSISYPMAPEATSPSRMPALSPDDLANNFRGMALADSASGMQSQHLYGPSAAPMPQAQANAPSRPNVSQMPGHHMVQHPSVSSFGSFAMQPDFVPYYPAEFPYAYDAYRANSDSSQAPPQFGVALPQNLASMGAVYSGMAGNTIMAQPGQPSAGFYDYSMQGQVPAQYFMPSPMLYHAAAVQQNQAAFLGATMGDRSMDIPVRLPLYFSVSAKFADSGRGFCSLATRAL